MQNYYRQLPNAINALKAAARVIEIKDSTKSAELFALASAMSDEYKAWRDNPED